MTRHFLLFVLTIVCMAVVGVASSATYKWVDENGVIHYSDKVPMDAQKSEKTVLDRQGRTVKRIDSDEQYLQRLEEEKQKAKTEEEEAKPTVMEYRDRALVLSYLTENDIDLARDRALLVLDGQIEATASMIEQLESRQESLEQRQQAGETIAEGELEKIHFDIEARRNTMTRYYADRKKVVQKYDDDKKRWRELKVIEEQRAREKEIEKLKKEQSR